MKKFRTYTEARFEDGLDIEAENLEDAERKVLEEIDIHEVDEKGEIID